MRSMWLIVDDGSFDENPVGWEDPITVDLTGHTYSPLHADDEVYGDLAALDPHAGIRAGDTGWEQVEAPDGYVGAHRA